MAGNLSAADKDAGVVPGLRQDGRGVPRGVLVGRGGKCAAAGQAADFFGVEFLYSGKAANLAFDAAVITGMIGFSADESIAADVVVSLDAFDDVNGKRQTRDPR